MSKLGRGNFVGHANIMEEFDRDKIGSRNAAWPLVLGVCLVGVGVDVDFVLDELGTEDMVVRGIAKGVESFVGVFDREFNNSRVIEASSMNGSVHVSTVTRALVRRED